MGLCWCVTIDGLKLTTTIKKIKFFNPKQCDLTYDPSGVRASRPAAIEPAQSSSMSHQNYRETSDQYGGQEAPTDATPTAQVTQAKLVQYARQDWSKIVQLSAKFYSAQMSGKLPADHPVRWRYSSHERDGRPCGLDLSGGFYDCMYNSISLIL